MRIYDHYGTCFECGLLTALNKNSLMCEDHDYEKRIESLEQKLKIAVEALEIYQKAPYATDPQGYEEDGTSFYVIEKNNEFVGVRSIATEALEKL